MPAAGPTVCHHYKRKKGRPTCEALVLLRELLRQVAQAPRLDCVTVPLHASALHHQVPHAGVETDAAGLGSLQGAVGNAAGGTEVRAGAG